MYRYVEQGLPPREAAIRGTNEVIAPVTVTILTTFAAFGPLLFMTDIIGKFIKQIPMVVIITLVASLIASTWPAVRAASLRPGEALRHV